MLCTLLLDLSPRGVWELGAVLEGDKIYQGYSNRFSLNFPSHCQVECAWMLICLQMMWWCVMLDLVFLLEGGLNRSSSSSSWNKQKGERAWTGTPTCPCTGSMCVCVCMCLCVCVCVFVCVYVYFWSKHACFPNFDDEHFAKNLLSCTSAWKLLTTETTNCLSFTWTSLCNDSINYKSTSNKRCFSPLFTQALLPHVCIILFHYLSLFRLLYQLFN